MSLLNFKQQTGPLFSVQRHLKRKRSKLSPLTKHTHTHTQSLGFLVSVNGITVYAARILSVTILLVTPQFYLLNIFCICSPLRSHHQLPELL